MQIIQNCGCRRLIRPGPLEQMKCSAAVQVPDGLHGDPEHILSEASASTTTVAFLDSLCSTSCESRQAFGPQYTSKKSKALEPLAMEFVLSLQC